MIRTILHQLWNQRRQNGWIFLELLVVSFFLWTVIDPIYVLLANRAIDRGYNPEGLYVVNIGMYDETNGNFNPGMASDSMNLVAYRRIVRIVREQPEVDSWSISVFLTATRGAEHKFLPIPPLYTKKKATYMPSGTIL